ncbi:MAG: hypothetical protein AAGA03_20300, partial [Planctomycetota bacterium]
MTRKRSLGGKRSVAGVILAVLIAVYGFAAPIVNQQFGWSLPELKPQQSGTVAASLDDDRPEKTASTRPIAEADSSTASKSAESEDSNTADSEDLKYGLLREVGEKRYLSPGGLLYMPGSAEGHRLEHLRRHTKDMPNRPGSHGVFDGGMEGMLATI